MATLSRFAFIAIVFLVMPGCATAIRGGSQVVVISSEPSGAVLSIDGVEKDTTPAVVSLERKSPHTIAVAIDGYAPERRVVLPDADYKLVALNLLLFHPAVAIAGTGIDLVTGAHHTLSPPVINLRLAITDSVAVARRRSDVPWQPVPIGSRIRVSTGEPSTPAVVGTLVAVSGDSLVLGSAASPVSRRIPRHSIGAIELGVRPDRHSGPLRWMWQGALAGIAAGVAVGAITHGAEGAYYLGFIYGAPIGLVVGAVAGAIVPPTERWLRIH